MSTLSRVPGQEFVPAEYEEQSRTVCFPTPSDPPPPGPGPGTPPDDPPGTPPGSSFLRYVRVCVIDGETGQVKCILVRVF